MKKYEVSYFSELSGRNICVLETSFFTRAIIRFLKLRRYGHEAMLAFGTRAATREAYLLDKVFKDFKSNFTTKLNNLNFFMGYYHDGKYINAPIVKQEDIARIYSESYAEVVKVEKQRRN